VDLGYLAEPTPVPTKYYDISYVEAAYQRLGW
jgi:hypothetical protein